MDYGEDYYESSNEYDEYDDDTYEAKTYLNTRTGPYPSNPVLVNKRPRKSRKLESQREEALRVPIVDDDEEMDTTVPIAPAPVATVSKPSRPRRKMLPAPIEKLDEFNIATYLQDLPCGLSVGQAAHEIPKYRSGLIRAVRRTREKETNYVEQHPEDDDNQTTAAKCELYVEQELITAVIDSGAATSIITSTLLKQLGYLMDKASKMVIVTG